jgi:hypothetical protein
MESEAPQDQGFQVTLSSTQKKRKLIISDDEEEQVDKKPSEGAPIQASVKAESSSQKPSLGTGVGGGSSTKALEKRAPDLSSKATMGSMLHASKAHPKQPHPSVPAPSKTQAAKTSPHLPTNTNQNGPGSKDKSLSWMDRSYAFDVPKTKYSLVYEILKRWWYVLPQWPPLGYDYKPILKEAKLREVSCEAFKFEPEEDAGKLKKVYQMPGYPGLFVDSQVAYLILLQGTKYDCRDRTNCPSFSNLKEKGQSELANLLEKALDNQIKSLASVPNYDSSLMEELKSFHGKILKAYSKLLSQQPATGNKPN